MFVGRTLVILKKDLFQCSNSKHLFGLEPKALMTIDLQKFLYALLRNCRTIYSREKQRVDDALEMISMALLNPFSGPYESRFNPNYSVDEMLRAMEKLGDEFDEHFVQFQPETTRSLRRFLTAILVDGYVPLPLTTNTKDSPVNRGSPSPSSSREVHLSPAVGEESPPRTHINYAEISAVVYEWIKHPLMNATLANSLHEFLRKNVFGINRTNGLQQFKQVHREEIFRLLKELCSFFVLAEEKAQNLKEFMIKEGFSSVPDEKEEKTKTLSEFPTFDHFLRKFLKPFAEKVSEQYRDQPLDFRQIINIAEHQWNVLSDQIVEYIAKKRAEMPSSLYDSGSMLGMSSDEVSFLAKTIGLIAEREKGGRILSVRKHSPWASPAKYSPAESPTTTIYLSGLPGEKKSFLTQTWGLIWPGKNDYAIDFHRIARAKITVENLRIYLQQLLETQTEQRKIHAKKGKEAKEEAEPETSEEKENDDLKDLVNRVERLNNQLGIILPALTSILSEKFGENLINNLLKIAYGESGKIIADEKRMVANDFDKNLFGQILWEMKSVERWQMEIAQLCPEKFVGSDKRPLLTWTDEETFGQIMRTLNCGASAASVSGLL